MIFMLRLLSLGITSMIRMIPIFPWIFLTSHFRNLHGQICRVFLKLEPLGACMDHGEERLTRRCPALAAMRAPFALVLVSLALAAACRGIAADTCEADSATDSATPAGPAAGAGTQDCAGIWAGIARVDACGVCGAPTLRAATPSACRPPP